MKSSEVMKDVNWYKQRKQIIKRSYINCNKEQPLKNYKETKHAVILKMHQKKNDKWKEYECQCKQMYSKEKRTKKKTVLCVTSHLKTVPQNTAPSKG